MLVKHLKEEWLLNQKNLDLPFSNKPLTDELQTLTLDNSAYILIKF